MSQGRIATASIPAKVKWPTRCRVSSPAAEMTEETQRGKPTLAGRKPTEVVATAGIEVASKT
jgi:hypothetical protein